MTWCGTYYHHMHCLCSGLGERTDMTSSRAAKCFNQLVDLGYKSRECIPEPHHPLIYVIFLC